LDVFFQSFVRQQSIILTKENKNQSVYDLLGFFYQDFNSCSRISLLHIVDQLHSECFVSFIKFRGDFFLFFSEMGKQVFGFGFACMGKKIISVQK